MKTTVYYFSSFVPPELIAACGCVPRRLDGDFESRRCAPTEGMCPFTQSRLETLLNRADTESFAAVFATTCDQMRRAYDLYCGRSDKAAFLLNVPSTDTPNAFDYYRGELARLSAFLCALSGTSFDIRLLSFADEHESSKNTAPMKIAVVGERVSESIHTSLANILAQAHIGVGLDASDDTLAGHFLDLDRAWLQKHPLDALASAYFRLPAVWKRPNNFFYEWFSDAIQQNKIDGVIVFRYIFCDLWHSAVFEMKKRLDVPVLQLDLDDSATLPASAVSRIQAFAEMLG